VLQFDYCVFVVVVVCVLFFFLPLLFHSLPVFSLVSPGRLNQMAKILLLFLLLIVTFNQCHCEYRQVRVKGLISCLDVNGASRPIIDGNVDLMEIDKHPNDGNRPWHEDTDDTHDTKPFESTGQFEVFGWEREWTDIPIFYLSFNLPCPPISYCTDREYLKRCAGKSTVAFAYFVDNNLAVKHKSGHMDYLDVKCYVGVKTSAGIEEGFSCSGGYTPERAH
ncbi:hypothetical protein PFISCL1PPCAC_21608, partial [Pristionchus fissidentatus]